jgi:hypothetical protein
MTSDGVTWEEYKQEYFDPAWDDYRKTPVELNKPEPAKVADETRDAWGRIKAEYYPVKYKALGRQFYREVLSDKQRLAYDIVATAVQNGQFEAACVFGINADEMRIALEALTRDFPEFFFLSGFAPISSDSESNVLEVIFPIYSPIEGIGVENALRRIAERAEPIVADAKQIPSPEERAKYIAERVCVTTSCKHLA